MAIAFGSYNQIKECCHKRQLRHSSLRCEKRLNNILIPYMKLESFLKMLLTKCFTYNFSLIQTKKLSNQISMRSSAFTPKNVEQSMSFLLIIKASSFIFVWKKETLPNRKHLFTMHLILSIEFMAQEDITDTKKHINKWRMKPMESPEMMFSGY